MADNFLITGYWGEPHVTAENDRGLNAATFGAGRFVLDVGEKFKAEYIGNNTIRIYDGKLLNNGAAAGIPAGEFVDLVISNAGSGMKRNDYIVFQYSQDASTLVERGEFVVIEGVETSGTPTDPSVTQQDLLSGTAVFDQMPLYRVSVSAATITAPVQLFDIVEPAQFKAQVALEAAESAQRTANAAAKPTTYTANASTSWTADATNGGYKQTISVSGILATDNPIADVVLGEDIDANALFLESWSLITRITTAANSITLWANGDAPYTAFTIQMLVVR